MGKGLSFEMARQSTRRSRNRSDASSKPVHAQISDAVLIPKRMVALVTCLVGLMLGVFVFLIASDRDTSVDTDAHLARENYLLFAQQLDEIYRSIERRTIQDPTELEKFVDILRIYSLYDHRFVRQNAGNDAVIQESAFAAQRLAQCALIFGDYRQSANYYRHAREHLDQLAKKDAQSLPLLMHDLIDAQTQIALLERRTGDSEQSKRELRAAIQYIEHPSLPAPARGEEWMVHSLEQLAALALELKLCDEALRLALLLNDAADRRYQEHPRDQQCLEQYSRAKELLERVRGESE